MRKEDAHTTTCMKADGDRVMDRVLMGYMLVVKMSVGDVHCECGRRDRVERCRVTICWKVLSPWRNVERERKCEKRDLDIKRS